MKVLESYVGSGWVSPNSDGMPLFNSVTGDKIGSISSDGIDFDAVVEHARSVGGPALREMTFHERAAILKELGKLVLSEDVKDELYEWSSKTGATRKDSWIDIDGGAGVLLTYSSKGRRELPNSKVWLDGAPEPLSPDGSFIGAHMYTPRKGVAVQINAFNFPVWGMLEKFAPAFLAGLPTIVKPASQTAYLTEICVRSIVDSGLLPDGALQLICGSAGDLLDHLDGQDSVGFTGSASTARLLRANQNIIANSVHFNAEADSLNSAVLTPSAGAGTAEFDLFVDSVIAEMTSKAGQKCTAIRRAFVPRSMLDEASERLAARVGSIVVGHPDDESVEMGALASLDQRTEVQAALATLSRAAEPLVGPAEFVGVDPGAGAFTSPALLRATDPAADVIHRTEAFGPVSTLVPYDDLDDAIALVARGNGSLVASIYGSDEAEVSALALGLAPHHGRVLVVDASVAESNTGHGSPLPHLIHGGPGRAGGGEELGGIRAVQHHMQRTAIQGSPDMVTEMTGVYMPGASTSDSGHPFRLNFDELQIGDSVTTGSRVVTLEDISRFAETTGDKFYAHTDPEAAAANPIFDGLVAHGYLVLSYAAGLFVWPEVGPVLANYGIDRLRFATPTYPGDEIHVVLTCERKTQLDGRGYGEVAWDTRVINQDGEVCAAYDVLTMVANAPGVNGAPPATDGDS